MAERTSLTNGQQMFLPGITVEGWDTTLRGNIDTQAVTALYADHATHDQFCAEIKIDLDPEHLRSGRFALNDLVIILGTMARNILRMIGQPALLDPMPRCAVAPSTAE
ncbi:hypothetical protein HF292_005420 [Acidithiobacillus ferruginosus]|uniref:Uncharacterized protein n=1 Tax=Acidithiobacillus ferruginosus TaxID=3063951 RepID=A0ACD5IM40_9PROT|nr:hypothetical protein [Acidithiobacillus ferruginosus]MBU2815115.1 hypothetical protein [Acidithiobacillus ferruginosus]